MNMSLKSTPLILSLYFLLICTPLIISGQSKRANPPSKVLKEKPGPSATPTATPTSSTPNLTEISGGADELQRLLLELKKRLANDSGSITSERSLEILAGELETRAQQADQILQSLPSLVDLQDLESEWTHLSVKLTQVQKSLAATTTVLDKDIAWLDRQQDKWNTIHDQISTAGSLEELRSRIQQSIEEIHSTKALAEDQLKFTVRLQTRISERDQLITGVLEKIGKERTRAQRGLFQTDSSPLWQFSAGHESNLGLQRVLRRDYGRDWVRLKEFVSNNLWTLFIDLCFLVLTLVVAIKMRRRLPAWVEKDITKSSFIHIFKRPYSVAVLAGLLATLPLLRVAPATVRGLLGLLLIIPTIRLLGPLIKPVDRQLLYTVVASNLAVQTIKIATMSVSLKRDLLGMLAIGIGCVSASLSRGMRQPADGHGAGRSIAVVVVRIGVMLMFVSFAANVAGYFALSQVLSDAVLQGSYYGAVLYTGKEIITIILSTVLKTEKANRIGVVHEYRATIIRSVAVFLTLGASVVWIGSLLNLLTIRDDVFDAVRGVLTKPLGFGEGRFTGADVISFLLVLVIGFLFAMASRVVLREDVLKRLPLRDGVPFALSTITYYVMLLFVCLLALLAAGVQLSKFTLFTGAFGIGVGFGLQNTINNFASGLVLLLERPIRENDILEVDGSFGEVTRIGMRSTSLRTAQEAEVIVPNSTLVTGKVINWSRLGRRRPIEIPVRVSYGKDPQSVIDLLVKTAATHSDVLSEPPPAAFLEKFGEKALEFLLVFWVGRYHLHRKVLSEVAIRVAEAFKEAGIQVPIPEVDSKATSPIDL